MRRVGRTGDEMTAAVAGTLGRIGHALPKQVVAEATEVASSAGAAAASVPGAAGTTASTRQAFDGALHIAVLGTDSNPSVHNIAAALQARGAVAHLIDLSDVTMSGGTLLHRGAEFPHLDGAIAYHGAEVPTNGLKHMRAMEREGIAFVNGPKSVTVSRDKWLAAQAMQHAGVRTPLTRLARTGDEARALLAEVSPNGEPTIIKLRIGTEGKGVMRISNTKDVPPVVDALSVAKRNAVLQQNIDMEVPADIRAVVVGGKVVEQDGKQAAMERVVGASKDGDFRTNLSNKGTATPITLHPNDKALAEAATKALGLDAAGIDLMGDRGSMYVIEGNSGFGQKIKDITGVDVVAPMADLAVRRAAEARLIRNGA